jgi:RNA polymerase sigma-70 factor, ECF subfamily
VSPRGATLEPDRSPGHRRRRPALFRASGAESLGAGGRNGFTSTVSDALPAHLRPIPDAESQTWLALLRSSGQEREDAVARLHELLLRAARFEVNRRRARLSGLSEVELDDIAAESANDAAAAVLRKLDDFRGDSRFTTWAYRFAILEVSVNLRRRAWRNREIPIESEHWLGRADGRPSPADDAEQRELFLAVKRAIDRSLTSHQRRVLTALALDDVPIDVLAERLGTTRGALYKTLHDARKKLRAEVAAAGFELEAKEAKGA